jgi:hypothetical protein
MFRRGRQGTDYNVAPDAATASASGGIGRAWRWWMGSPVTKAFSTVFMVVMVGGVLVMLVWPKPDPISGASTPPAAAPSTTPVTTAPAEKPVCKPQEAKAYLPEEVILAKYTATWTRVGDMSEPSSHEGGPGIRKPYPQCFTRTPEGALYAATSFVAQASVANAQGEQKEFFTARASHTGNYTMLIADLPAASPPQNRPTITISGYLWNSYTPDQASLQLRFRTVDSKSLSRVYNLAWERNDWLLIVPGPGDKVSTDPTNKSFTPWGAL